MRISDWSSDVCSSDLEGREDDPDLLRMSGYMLDYPFAERIYPGALETVERLHALGTPVVLSDGDVVFQPRKVQRSGLREAMRGRVLIDRKSTRLNSRH